MTKHEFIGDVAERSGLSRKDAESAVNAMFGSVSAQLGLGADVALAGLGTFKVKERAARVGHNPATGEKVNIPAKTAVTFKASKTLKDLVNS